ncbi:serine/threonine-protein kinase [Microbulbifer sp. CAU 1566]|uniref:serine/threonine-protein kinase n=1 Tax=Microbulbifer sp. CAU 1566 TaxID=2933269 RepID=UPI0020029D42|nr:serine/threonine-protein kinase [Microbulbifer sp. CAU 1566]MCK7596257.1 serine/threonine-protein kinase [Microbulbifer sp. CAU 1566]
MQTEQLPFYIGRYHATARLGSGGMGVVYLATDERLNRQVAIKKLLRNPNSSNASERIRREALLLAQLNHNNIVQLYDVVEGENDIALVMEYVDGCNLQRWQRERSPDLVQKLQLLKQICAGLTRAHSAGIIHRDLKAENILVDSSGTIKITDFGIAKNLQEDSDLTREQHVAGSWGAMSPEQAQGKPLDNRSDLFALGVVAYRLLCDQNPFGDNSSPYVTVDRIVKHPHPPASKLAPELPPALCALLDQLLAKQPEQRPINAAAVAAELDQQLIAIQGSGSFTRTHTITATVTAESFYQQGSHRPRLLRHIALGTLATGLLAAATLALLNSDLLSKSTAPAASKYIAVLEPLDRDKQAALSREQRLLVSNVQNALKQGLSNRSGLNLISFAESRSLRGEPLAAQAKSLSADLLLVPAFDCDPLSCELSLELLDSDTLAVIASRSTRLAVVEEGLESRGRTLHQVNHLLPDYPARGNDQPPHISDADYLTYLEIYEQRSDQLHQATLLDQLEELQKTAGTFAPLYELYAAMVIDREANSRAADADKRLASFLRKAPASLADTPELLIGELRLAIHVNDAGRAEALLARLKLVLPDRASYYFLSALYHHRRGAYPQALEEINNALALRTSYVYLTQKALALTQMGDMPAANEVLREAMTRYTGFSDANSLLASNLLDLGQPEEAIRLLTEVGAESLGPLDLYNLCQGYYIEKHYRQAQRCFDRLARLSPDDADPLLYRAEIAHELGQAEQAPAFAQRALQITQGRDDWEALLLQARAYAELGEAEKAVDNLIRIRRDAPDDIYVNYARAQVYITTGDLLSAKAHIRKTLEQGFSPIWYCTARFVKICDIPAFNDLRQQYPGLCGGTGNKNNAGNSQIASSGDANVNL